MVSFPLQLVCLIDNQLCEFSLSCEMHMETQIAGGKHMWIAYRQTPICCVIFLWNEVGKNENDLLS